MLNAKVVIGAGFGDEGKGLMTDYFCSQFPKDKPVLNVRFNGGAQAGHTVVTPIGQRHVFGHLGAGSFLPNVVTYLAAEYIVNPILFRIEYEKMEAQGIHPIVIMHPRCLLTIPQDMMINQMVERHRGQNRHGSCGVGIFETMYRSKTDFIINLGMASSTAVYNRLVDRDYSQWHLAELGVEKVTDHDAALLTNKNIAAHYAADIEFLKNHVTIMDEQVLKKFENVVFEGAQGLLLDQNNLDYFPHLTPSNTGIQNVSSMLSYCDLAALSVEVCYVTRPYLTRHGAGMFMTECDRNMVNAKVDQTNHHNEFQGGFRYGYHDPLLIEKAIEKDKKFIPETICDYTIAVTHADETADLMMCRNRKMHILDWDTEKSIGVPVRYISHGNSRMNISKVDKRW